MTEEEIQVLRNELEESRGEAEFLKTQLIERNSAFKPLEEELTETRARLTETTEEKDNIIATVANDLTIAIESYKSLILNANPLIPTELIKGDTIEAINTSLENAKGVVGKVRANIEADIKNTDIPAGAPPRTSPDLSNMSPRDKIKHALAKNLP